MDTYQKIRELKSLWMNNPNPDGIKEFIFLSRPPTGT